LDGTKQEHEEHYERCEQFTRDRELEELIRRADIEITQVPPGKPPKDLYSRYPTPKDSKRRMTDLDDYEEEELLTWQDIGLGLPLEYEIEQLLPYLSETDGNILMQVFCIGKSNRQIGADLGISHPAVRRNIERIGNKIKSK